MITTAQAAAIYCLKMFNGGYVIPEQMREENWFIARVKPVINQLVKLGLLQRNKYDNETPYSLTPEASEEYSKWYQAVGFRKDSEIQSWLY
jgi:hypothetical protein